MLWENCGVLERRLWLVWVSRLMAVRFVAPSKLKTEMPWRCIHWYAAQYDFVLAVHSRYLVAGLLGAVTTTK
jgi:hypothetical protein